MVLRRFSRNSLRPINRIKHVIDQQLGLAVGTESTIVLIDSVDAPVLTTSNQVQTGASVNAIYLKVEANAVTSAALSNFYMIVAKNPGTNVNLPPPNAVGIDDNKRFVIHQEMVMFQQVNNSNPRTVFNGVIVIPKGMRRMAPDDNLVIIFLAPGVQTNICLQCHYKEFR